MKRLILLALSIALTGCLSTTGMEMITAESISADNCRTRILDTKLKIAAVRAHKAPVTVTFKDERNYVMLEMVNKMADITVAVIEANAGDVTDSCDSRVLALINLESRRISNQYRLGGQAISVTGLLGGATILSDTIGHNNNGTSSTTNISGSRVVSGSGNQGGNASASGEGLISLPTDAGRDAAGGAFPRQLNGSGGGSNSGEQADNDFIPVLPIEP